MKPLCAILAMLCAAAAFSLRADAQITITATDVTTQFSLGAFTTSRFDSTATSVNIGRKGASSWDFSSLQKSGPKVGVVTLTSIKPDSSPYTAMYTGTTHVLRTNTTFTFSGVTLPVTAYIHFKLATDLLNLGEGASAIGATPYATIANVPADLFYKLPSTYGTTWTSTYKDTTIGYLTIGVPIFNQGRWHNASYVVDAYGPLTLPGGSVHQVLRIKKTDSVFTTPAGTSAKGVGYIFLGSDGTLVQVSAANATGPDSGTIAVYPPVSWANAINTSVSSAAGATPEKFSLEQNYPNPFNPSTAISYALPARSVVHLAVYNVLGQMVAELVNGEQEAGTHSVEWRPAGASGIYFCRIEAAAADGSGRFTDVKKMAYVR